MLVNFLILAAITFVVSLTTCLLITPKLIKFAVHRQLMDHPSKRRVHQQPTPRIGGLAIFVSFFIALSIIFFWEPKGLTTFSDSHNVLVFAIGALILFAMGLYDDIRSLRTIYKLLIHSAVASLAWWGGAQVDITSLPGIKELQLGYLSLPVTVFWFLLLINAINLIDGLDGLASGITVLSSLVLAVLCLVTNNYAMIPLFTALAGATLGFLRYNFNPASIFMGDCGSYFLGYCLAYFSIIGSIKGQTAVTILIPLIAIGMPVFEVMFTPIRRFVSGQDLFKPDADHFHHRLLKKGLSHKTAVLILYGLSVFLGVVALVMVHLHSMASGFLLLGLGLVFVLGIRKLGYLEYIAVDKIIGWVRDIIDEVGLLRDRRTFLGRQMVIASSEDLEKLSENIVLACQHMDVDYMKICFPDWDDYEFEYSSVPKCQRLRHDLKNLQVKMPLSIDHQAVGSLTLEFHLNGRGVEPFTLRRAEQLRRVTCSTLKTMYADKMNESPDQDSA
jgi:UDP-GlcNAc:undecaprenyl-phosphate GlcNAc-1-phosphate transferase